MFNKKGKFRLNSTATEGTTKPSVYRGLIYASLSGVLYSLVGVIVKYVKNLHPGQLALYRFIATFAMCLPDTVKTDQNLWGPRNLRILLMLRGVFGGLNLFLNFIAFRYLGLGEASVIIFSSPVFVTIFARVIFKEPCNILQSITVVITVIGIVFIAKLPSRLSNFSLVYDSEKIYGLLAAIFAMFSVTTLHLITRKVRPIHPSILTFHFSWMGTLGTAILTGVFGNFQLHQCGIQSVFILLLAILSYGGITLIVMAFQCENAGPVSTLRATTDIASAFLWQILIFHDIPDLYGIIGAILIVLSIVLIGLDKLKTSSLCIFLSCKKFP